MNRGRAILGEDAGAAANVGYLVDPLAPRAERDAAGLPGRDRHRGLPIPRPRAHARRGPGPGAPAPAPAAALGAAHGALRRAGRVGAGGRLRFV